MTRIILWLSVAALVCVGSGLILHASVEDKAAIAQPLPLVESSNVLHRATMQSVPYEKGELLFADDFETAENWSAELESGGEVVAGHGRLTVNVPRGCTVWFRSVITGAVMIEFTATVVSAGGPNDRVSDLNCFWMARDTRSPEDLLSYKRNGVFSDYNRLTAYYVGLGGNSNTTTRFRRYIGDVALRPLLPSHDLRDAKYLIEANARQQIRLVAYHNLIQYFRDEELIFSYEDEAPYSSGWFGLRTVANHMEVTGFRVHRLTSLKRP